MRLQHSSLIVSVFDRRCLSQSHRQSKMHTGSKRQATFLGLTHNLIQPNLT